jgi:hypothetical protein
MKTKLLVSLLLGLVLFNLSKSRVLASGFNIKSIGSVNTSGQQLSHWWYTNSNPTFVGEAPSGSTVSISIDGTETSVTADGSNSWSYTSGSLSAGDHTIIVGNNDSTIKFTLTIGTENINWDAVNKGSSETLPTAGIVLPTLALSMSGLGFIFGAKKLAKNK